MRTLLEIYTGCRKQSGISDAVRGLQRCNQVMRRRLAYFLIPVLVVLLDRLTKVMIKGRFSAFDTLTVIPGLLNIIHTENPGIAFGMLANTPGPWRNVLLVGFSAAVLIAISTILL